MSFGFDFHRFDINRFDEKVFTYTEEELQLLEEVYKKTLKKIIDDGVSVTDSLVIVLHKHLESEATYLIDNILLSRKKGAQDTQGVADVLSLKIKRVIEDHEDVLESFISSFVKRFPEVILLHEVIEKTYKKIVEDGLSLTDSIRADVRSIVTSTALDLIDSLGAIEIEKHDQDVENIVEEVSKRFITSKEDEIENVSDELSKWIISKVPIEDIQASDEVKKDTVKRNYEALSVDDLTEFSASKPLDDVDEVADSYTIDAQLYKEDQIQPLDEIRFDFDTKSYEIIAVSELVQKKFGRNLASEVEKLGDDFDMNINKHHNELHEVQDQHEKGITKVNRTSADVTDHIEAGFVDYGAIVYVNGLKIRVLEGLTIADSTNGRVSTCTFQLVNIEDWLIDVLHMRAEVHVMLFDGNQTEHFGGRISANPVSWRGHAPTMNVEDEDFTATADDFKVNQTYRDMYVHEVVQAMWNEFYEVEIDYDIEESNVRIPEISFYFETLFDATEVLAEQVGWSWYIDWDGGKRTLKFFSPETNVFPDRLGWGHKNVLEDGLQFGRDHKMFNALYLFGGEATSEPLSEKNEADGDRKSVV